MQVHLCQAPSCSSIPGACLQQLVELDSVQAPPQKSSTAAGFPGLEGAGAAAAGAVRQGKVLAV
jgi:hypothetical protein